MSSRRGRRKGRGRGKGKGKGRTRNQSGSLSTSNSTSNLRSTDNLSTQHSSNNASKSKPQPEIFVGLDFGASFIKIAAVQNNLVPNLDNLQELESLFLNTSNNASAFHSKINFLADDTGQRCIPSVITILDANHNEMLIGSEAIKSSIRNYKNCIYHSKYLTSFTQNNPSQNDNKSIDISSFQSQYSQWKRVASKFGMHKCIKRPIFEDDDEDEENEESKQKEKAIIPFLKLRYQIKKTDGNSFREFVIDNAIISMLKKIFKVISSQTGSTKINIVSTVPYNYTSQQIDSYKSLLLQSGFNPLQIIYDHSASILSLNLDNNKDEIRNVLCIDFGTFYSTFSVIKLHKGLITSTDTKLNNNYYTKSMDICGTKLDECILKWLIKDFENRNKGCYIEIENAKCRLKLLKEISRIKQVLSSGSNQVRFDIESLYEGIDYHFQLSKAKFESIIYDILSSIKNWINDEIKKCQLNIDKVIVSGGLAEIPRLQTILENIFGDKLISKQINSKGISPLFINAYGCAVQAASLSYIYQFQNQIQIGHQSLHKIIDVTKPAINVQKENKSKSHKTEQNGLNMLDVNAKNAFLNKLSDNQISLSSRRINMCYILAQSRKQFCCIERYTALPFDTVYKIQEEDVKLMLNDNKEIEEDLDIDISFTVDIIDEDEKSVIDTTEKSMNTISLKAEEKNKAITINVSLDENNNLNINIGKEKIIFELEADNESEDDEDNETDIKIDKNDNDEDTLDID